MQFMSGGGAGSNLMGQSAASEQYTSIGTTTLYSVPDVDAAAGGYRVTLILACTTADASSAVVEATVAWTGDGVVRSFTSSQIGIASTSGYTLMVIPSYADKNTLISYSTTVTGTPSTGRYAVYVWVEKVR